MADVGKLILGVAWDGDKVTATEIRSTRPQASLILQGKTPQQVLQIVPLLFSVCGRAQGVAAQAALQAAQQSTTAVSDAQECAIVCEAMQEHLWRLLLDWPKLLGLATQEQLFTGWYTQLRKIGAGEIGLSSFLHGFERDALGMSAAEWRGITSFDDLQTWWKKSDTSLAKSLEKLAELEQDARCMNESRLLPSWSAAEAQMACAGGWNTVFAARPEWLGAAAETGAWSYHADHSLLRDVWRQSGSRVLTRLLARVLDTVEMASGKNTPRLDAVSPVADEGVAVVRTARGLLLHRVQLAAGKVAAYTIVAPTEWNFHPSGAFAQDLRGMQINDAERVKQLAQISALSLDPCVAYEVEIRNA